MVHEIHEVHEEREKGGWSAIVALADRQRGVIATWQLARLSVGRGLVDHQTRLGRLHRVHRGVYAVGFPKLDRRRAWMAAVLGGGPGAALTSHSALYAWGARRYDVRAIHIATSTHRREPVGVTHHQSRTRRWSDIVIHDDIPMATVERALVEAATDLTVYELVNTMHRAAQGRRFRVAAMEQQLKLNPSCPGRAKLVEALAHFRAGSRGADSKLEVRAHVMCERRGWPPPLVNVTFDLGDGGYPLTPDLRWPDPHVVVEVDGGGHELPMSRADDEDRDRRWAAIGYTVVRVTERDLAVDGARATCPIERALGPL